MYEVVGSYKEGKQTLQRLAKLLIVTNWNHFVDEKFLSYDW